ncbi:prolipoprotein diacylglyceryl transferase domain-containing protein [Ditylenchus destructor]|uniref:Prolipoprotein diacylglyceryl transferase domain-containing protein n=1 Tax=Ditylenchus destructor TaxID=166010 RepID=A0AAD4QSH0_9BILA|nr:prolipoprotein diacylglyceryl transferase domain-containing protein [Ditylenchus destructor]
MIDPVAVEIGPLAIKWYGLAYVVGCSAAGGMPGCSWRRTGSGASGRGRNRSSSTICCSSSPSASCSAAETVFVLFYDLPRYIERPQDILAIWQGGMSFHGGLIGATLGLWLFAKRRGYPVLSVFDLAAAVVPIGLFLGRIAISSMANSGAGWHRISRWRWCSRMVGRCALSEPALRGFLRGHPALRAGQPAGLDGLVPQARLRRRRLRHRLCLARIACEFFREPDPQLGFLFGRSVDALSGGITMGMLLSLPVLAAGIWLIATSRRERRTTLKAELIRLIRDEGPLPISRSWRWRSAIRAMAIT